MQNSYTGWGRAQSGGTGTTGHPLHPCQTRCSSSGLFCLTGIRRKRTELLLMAVTPSFGWGERWHTGDSVWPICEWHLTRDRVGMALPNGRAPHSGQGGTSRKEGLHTLLFPTGLDLDPKKALQSWDQDPSHSAGTCLWVGLPKTQAGPPKAGAN